MSSSPDNKHLPDKAPDYLFHPVCHKRNPKGKEYKRRIRNRPDTCLTGKGSPLLNLQDNWCLLHIQLDELYHVFRDSKTQTDKVSKLTTLLPFDTCQARKEFLQ
jgi:hypothetical protein